jgi:hypothetical protein
MSTLSLTPFPFILFSIPNVFHVPCKQFLPFSFKIQLNLFKTFPDMTFRLVKKTKIINMITCNFPSIEVFYGSVKQQKRPAGTLQTFYNKLKIYFEDW